MSVNPLETYLTELRETRDSGAATKETSGYGTLAKLLDAVGHCLKPRVRCLIQLKNSGAGLPDGGLFTPDQLKNADEEAPLLGLDPARGVIEVKAAVRGAGRHRPDRAGEGIPRPLWPGAAHQLPRLPAAQARPRRRAAAARILSPRRQRSRFLGRRRAPAQNRRRPGRTLRRIPQARDASRRARSTARATSPSSSPPTPATPAPASSTPAISPPWPPSAPRWKRRWA